MSLNIVRNEPARTATDEQDRDFRIYMLVFAISVAIFAVELAGGLCSGSLALASDAWHALLDGLAYLACALALKMAQKGIMPTGKVRRMSGYFNAFLLAIITTIIAAKAWERLKFPPEIMSTLMILVAALGLVANYIQFRIAEKAGVEEQQHATHKSAIAHVISDLAQSVMVVVGGIAIALTHWRLIDPLLSFVVVIFMLRLTINLIHETMKEPDAPLNDH
jgi:cobalt-zinc-cadmium efflux system protein